VNVTDQDEIAVNREMMKSNFPDLKSRATDQKLNRPQPPLQKPCPGGTETIVLPAVNPAVLGDPDLYLCMKRRRSRRSWIAAPLTLEELSFLLWATQGVQRTFGRNYSTFRPVPSGGGRHPFETYLAVNRVAGLEPGLYRYLPLSHQLAVLERTGDLGPRLTEVCLGQEFVGDAAVVFIWSCIPYRGEWRYSVAAHKIMLLDAGHLCQNLYLACEAIGSGTCAVAAYDQQRADSLVRLDGVDEFVVYLAPVGRVKR
jgi:SagB-type dehydrogenase family enzyme